MECLFVFLSAFEFSGGSGPAGAMLAGGAVADWRHGLRLNPALVDTVSGLGAGIGGCRPYGLEGVIWTTTALHMERQRWSVSLGAASLALGRFRESDFQLVCAGSPVTDVWLGAGTHFLLLNQNYAVPDLTLALDAGARYAWGRFAVGAAVSNLNRPRWRDDTVQPARLTLSAAWQPVDELLLATDVVRTAGSEAAAGGVEFRLAPPIALRVGAATAPLHYAGGLEVTAGWFGIDYAWRFHPQLKDTHVVGLCFKWR